MELTYFLLRPTTLLDRTRENRQLTSSRRYCSLQIVHASAQLITRYWCSLTGLQQKKIHNYVTAHMQ